MNPYDLRADYHGDLDREAEAAAWYEGWDSMAHLPTVPEFMRAVEVGHHARHPRSHTSPVTFLRVVIAFVAGILVGYSLWGGG
jgi:hypothetical protein